MTNAACSSASTRVRFSDAQSVFETFGDLSDYAPIPLQNAEAIAYARTLSASSRATEATAFIAHVLPRREAVWWASQCVRALLGAQAEDAALHAAEAWVRTPDEAHRQAALEAGSKAGKRGATAFLARAAGWSGGSLTAPDQARVSPPEAACAMAANAAIALAAVTGNAAKASENLRACALAGIRFAEGGSADVSLSH